jgi:hypothetical protein
MAHSVHDVDEAAEYLPFAQVVHETALYVLENVPTAHLAHEPTAGPHELLISTFKLQEFVLWLLPLDESMFLFQSTPLLYDLPP